MTIAHYIVIALAAILALIEMRADPERVESRARKRNRADLRRVLGPDRVIKVSK